MVRFSLCTSTMMIIAMSGTFYNPGADAFSVERRGFLAKVGSSIATGTAAAIVIAGGEPAMAATAKTGQASQFTGDYEDPNHPNCLRQVKVVGAPLRPDGTRSQYPVIEVTGYDGNGSDKTCTERPTRSDLWKIQGKLKNSNEAIIDFSPKGGPSNLLATWQEDGIVFPDGNKWTKVPGGTPMRRPEDMSTLKSN